MQYSTDCELRLSWDTDDPARQFLETPADRVSSEPENPAQRGVKSRNQ